MTDTEAKKVALDLVYMRAKGPLRELIDHALQAIEDRAALVEMMESVVPRLGRCNTCSTARRHMRGEG